MIVDIHETRNGFNDRQITLILPEEENNNGCNGN